jgi:hypothetical protein
MSAAAPVTPAVGRGWAWGSSKAEIVVIKRSGRSRRRRWSW